MNTYTFKINAVDVHTQVGDLEKVVYNVHWSYIGEDENGNTASIIGVQSVDEPNADNFTSFDQLVQDDIISWIEPNFVLSEMQSNLDAQIAEIATPTKQTLQVPVSLETTEDMAEEEAAV